MLSLQMLLAIGLGLIIGAAVDAFAPLWLAIPAGLAALGWLMHWFRRLDNRFFAYYLLHDYAFSAQFYGANPPALQARMQAFGAQIFKALNGDVDEVLVVGHSSGAHLAVSVLADLLRRHDLDPKGPKLAFLTLGHVVPMVSFLPKADQLRADLNYLCQQDCLTWVDVTAPGDGCTFALCDPVGVSGVAPQTGQIWPLVISAAFTQSLSPEFYASIKRRYFRLHFQYLCAFDRPQDYDYFQITAGPMTLASRFEGRAPSPSLIAEAHSPHTTMHAP